MNLGGSKVCVFSCSVSVIFPRCSFSSPGTLRVVYLCNKSPAGVRGMQNLYEPDSLTSQQLKLNSLQLKYKCKHQMHPSASKFLPEQWISCIIHGEGGSLRRGGRVIPRESGNGRIPSLWFEPLAENVKLACSSHTVHLLLILSSS